MLRVLMRNMGIFWQTQLEPKLEVCLSIMDRQVKASLARATGPDFGNFLQASQEESLFRESEGGGVEVHLFLSFALDGISFPGDHFGNLNWKLAFCCVKSADTTCQL
jgi:hypothetical protein